MAGIAADVLRKIHEDTILTRTVIPDNEQDISVVVYSGYGNDSEEHLVVEEFGDSDTEDQSDNDSLPLIRRTRYGRMAGNWNLFRLY